MKEKSKSPTVGYLLAFFLGGFGAHLFYYQKYLKAAIYLLFVIFSGGKLLPLTMVLGWIDMFFIKKWQKEYSEREEKVSKGLTEALTQLPFTEKITQVKKLDPSPEKVLPQKKKERFYKEEDIILPEYAHLETPLYIRKEVEELKNSVKAKKSSSPAIEITFSTRDTEFMKDSIKYTDMKFRKADFVPLKVYWTTFRDLDERQKRWYFYWRYQALNGNYLDTDLSYVILFVYELLNYTFNQNAAFNISMMVRLREVYKDRLPDLDRYIVPWIRDMLVELNEIELAYKWGLGAEPYYGLNFYQIFKEYQEDISKVPMEEWRKVLYGYSETTFFKTNARKVYAVFEQALKLFQKINVEEGLDLEKAWFRPEEKMVTYHFFSSAIIGRNIPSRVIKYLQYVPTDYFYNEVTALFRLSENVARLLAGVTRQVQVNEELLPPGFREALLQEIKRLDLTEDIGLKSRFSPDKKIKNRFSQVASKEKERSKHIIPPKPVQTTGIDGEKIEPELHLPEIDIPENRSRIRLSDEEVDVEGFISSLTEEESKFISTFSNRKKSINEANELIKNLSTKSAPQGNALPIILDQWIMGLRKKIMEDLDYEDKAVLEDSVFIRAVEKEIVKAVSQLDELTGGYDFAKVLSIYYKSFVKQDKEKQRQALRWLRGEYLTKTDTMRDLGIREIIDDSNYYAYLKVLCKFVRQAGYSGLIINLDEAVNLYKITHREARERNYDYILMIYNDILQGSVEGLYITFSGTPEFLEEERRGLYSYQALKRRLRPAVEKEEYQDLRQAVMKLTPLTPEETLILLMNIRDIHAAHYGYEINVTDEEIRKYLLWTYKRPGAERHIILGDVIREFISFLNIKMEHPTLNFEELYIGEETSENNSSEEVIDIHKRFKRTQLS